MDCGSGASLQLGRRRVPGRLATGHFAFVGATGSGKTLLQRLLMQSVLPTLGAGQRALVYDPKQHFVSLLAGMNLPCPVRILNPFDRRSVAWEMAEDITSPAAALQAATLLVPSAKADSNPFFTNAARLLVQGVFQALILAFPGTWTFRQVLLILRNKSRLKALLSKFESTSHLVQLLEHPITASNILSTVLTYTAPFEVIAAAWDFASESISLRSWIDEEEASVLVLGNDESNRSALDTVNRFLFKRLSELVLASDEVPDTEDASRTWFFLDEIREAGRLDGLSSLMTKGRSKGACVVLGFQDMSGLREVYGRDVADELVGQASSKVVLRLNSPETAKWASSLFGASEILETHYGTNRSRSSRKLGLNSDRSTGESVSHSVTKRDLVLASEFLGLPETTPQTGLSGYFVTPATGPYFDAIPGPWLASHILPAAKHVPSLVVRPDSHQYLRPWVSGEIPSIDDALHRPRPHQSDSKSGPKSQPRGTQATDSECPNWLPERLGGHERPAKLAG